MNQRQLASVLFAVVGLLVIAMRLPELVISVGMLADPHRAIPADTADPRYLSALVVTMALVSVLIGAGLIVARNRLAARLFPADGERLVAPEAQAVALSVLGCYFVVQGISRIGWSSALRWTAAVQIVLGVALFFGARGLSRVWSAVRSAGIPARDPTTSRV